MGFLIWSHSVVTSYARTTNLPPNLPASRIGNCVDQLDVSAMVTVSVRSNLKNSWPGLKHDRLEGLRQGLTSI